MGFTWYWFFVGERLTGGGFESRRVARRAGLDKKEERKKAQLG